MKNFLGLVLILGLVTTAQAENRRRQKNHGQGQNAGRQNSRAEAPQAGPVSIYEAGYTGDDMEVVQAELRGAGVLLHVQSPDVAPPTMKYIACANTAAKEAVIKKFAKPENKLDLAKLLNEAKGPFTDDIRRGLAESGLPRTVVLKLQNVPADEDGGLVVHPADIIEAVFYSGLDSVLRPDGTRVEYPKDQPGDVRGEHDVRLRKFNKQFKAEVRAAGELRVQIKDGCDLYRLLDLMGQAQRRNDLDGPTWPKYVEKLSIADR